MRVLFVAQSDIRLRLLYVTTCYRYYNCLWQFKRSEQGETNVNRFAGNGSDSESVRLAASWKRCNRVAAVIVGQPAPFSIAQTYNNTPLNMKLAYQSCAYSSFTTGQWILFHFFASSWDSINNPKLLLYFKLYFDGPVAQWCMHTFLLLSFALSPFACPFAFCISVNRAKWPSILRELSTGRPFPILLDKKKTNGIPT